MPRELHIRIAEHRVLANMSRGVDPATAQVHALAQRRESDNLPLADCSASGSDAQHEACLCGPLL